MLTDEQIRLLRKKRMEGKTQVVAGAAAGMSERSARKWEKGPLPSETKERRTWRTRADVFVEVWEPVVVPLLRADERGELEAKTVLDVLKQKNPGSFDDVQLRTLQRRIREWRALYGPEKEVFFEQEHVPGREGAFDFTDGKELDVTICGIPFLHLLFEFVLSFSGWTWVCLAFGETFEALTSGLQGALWDLGGVPSVIRSDNLSAATRELRKTGGRTLTRRYGALLDHYGAKSTRINPGESHENGVVEQRHFRTKRAIAQSLVLRGSRDFESEEEYLSFVRETVQKNHNDRISQERLFADRAALLSLPSTAIPNYTIFRPTVRKWSTIRLGGKVYSVPSRLIGHEVEVRQHADVVEVLVSGRLVETMPRLRGEVARIDYRHVIWSLVKKPGAFARFRYKEELFPTLTFRRAYDALRESRGERADVEYVRILHLAASTMESIVEAALEELLSKGSAFDYATVRKLTSPEPHEVPEVEIPAPDLTTYDVLLVGGGAE